MSQRTMRYKLTALVSYENFAIEYLVVPQYVVQHLLVQVLGRTLKGDFHSTGFLRLQIDVAGSDHKPEGAQSSECHIRRLSIQSDADSFKFCFNQSSLFGFLRGIQYHKDQVTCLHLNSEHRLESKENFSANLCSRNDLSTSAFALGSAFNDSWKIQDLYLGASILKDARDRRKGSERVGGDFALRLGDLGKKGRLPNRREANERYAGITALAHIEATSTA